MITSRTYGWDVWPELEELFDLQSDFSRAFNNWYPARGYRLQPPTSVWVGNDNAVVEVELPGVDPKNVDIAVEDDQLTISGKREREPMPDDAKVYRQERATGSFTRTLELPFGVDADMVKASYKNGMLRIELPRAEAEKPHRIAIQAA